MNVARRVEMSSLIERLSSDDMPVVAVAILAAWCARPGVNHDRIGALVRLTIDAVGSDDLRHILVEMLAGYETGLALIGRELRGSAV
jgi:hypothetical protein